MHLCLQDMALAHFRCEVTRQLTERLGGLESISDTLVDKIKELGEV